MKWFFNEVGTKDKRGSRAEYPTSSDEAMVALRIMVQNKKTLNKIFIFKTYLKRPTGANARLRLASPCPYIDGEQPPAV